MVLVLDLKIEFLEPSYYDNWYFAELKWVRFRVYISLLCCCCKEISANSTRFSMGES